MIIEIPGEITFSRTYNIPPVPVELPLTAHARTSRTGMRTIIGLCLTLPFLALWLVMTAYAGEMHTITPWRWLVAWVALSYCLLVFLPPTIFGMLDITRRGAALILDEQRFIDRRGNVSVRWSDISSAHITYMGHHTGVRLFLRDPIQPRSLFDRGGKGLLGRRKADVYEVSVGDLSERAYILSQTMLMMVQRNGGTAKR